MPEISGGRARPVAQRAGDLARFVHHRLAAPQESTRIRRRNRERRRQFVDPPADRRFAGRVAATVARLATGWAAPLRRTGIAPAGPPTEFHEVSQLHSFPTDVAWSHRKRLSVQM